MKYSIIRVQKFMTMVLALHILLLLSFAYTTQNQELAYVIGGMSLFVFLSVILAQEKRSFLIIWFSTLCLTGLSLSALVLLHGNSFYIIYHLFLPTIFLLYFRKGPIYFYGIVSGAFFIILYFFNDRIQIYPEKISLFMIYLLATISFFTSVSIVFVMTKLSKYVNFAGTDEVKKVDISLFLEPEELPYIFYLKAIGDNITSTADEVRHTVERNIDNIKREKSRLGKIVEVALIIQKAFNTTKGSVDVTKNIIETTMKASLVGETKVSDIMEMVNRMIKFVDITRKSIYDLTAATKKVEGVIGSIDKIANQTRLLSLNASIEGARFHDKQIGFAMVSKEVKELSALTHLSVQDITNTMRDIHNKTRSVQEIISKEGEEAMEGFEVAKLGEQSIKYVVRMLQAIQSQIVDISEELDVNRDIADKIVDNFNIIQTFINENFARMEELAQTSSDMRIQGEHLGKIIHARRINEMLAKQNDRVYGLLTRFARDFEIALEHEIRRGIVEEKTLFMREYSHVSREGLERYKSGYDSFFETSIQKLIDHYMNLNSDFKYFVVMDNEGYVPLVNSINLKNKTPDEELKIEIINKPGVILQDFVSKYAIKSEALYSLQCIQTKEEPVMDMSLQLHYKDRVWGVVRAGFCYS
ncbi:MAG: methyl-accepting chemotaxis protein [Spirochaetia bacterium]|nr:methyl-accepting chemotaxis protein [Spirochaetia bacterium]